MDDTKERERAFHDARFGQRDDPRDALAKYYSLTAASNDLYRQWTAEAAGPGKQLLEYGCGTGGDFRFYRKLGCTVHGIDISGEAIAKAQRDAAVHGVPAHYSVQDAENTNFADGQFDVVVGSGILHHLDLDRALSELARITHANGVCVFNEPLGHNPAINLFRRLTPKLRTDDEHPLVRPDFEAMRRHFDEVEVRHYYLFTLGAVVLRRTRFFDRAYQSLMRLDQRLIQRWPALGYHAWICVIALRRPKHAATAAA